MFKRILVPLDGSRLAERILPYAVVLAAHHQAELFLLRVVKKDHNQQQHPTVTDATEYLENLRAELQGELVGNTPLSYTVRLLVARSEPDLANHPAGEKMPYKTSTLVVSGDAGKQIVQATDQVKADLIAMSTHGRAGWDRVLHGSVAVSVLHETALPVLLLHLPPEEKKVSLQDAFRNVPPNFLHRPVLLPLSGDEQAEVVIPLARKLASDGNAPLTLMQVISNREEVIAVMGATTPGYLIGEETGVEELKELARTYLSTVRHKYLGDYSQVNFYITEGDAGAAILDYAERHLAGFIVMASHARTGFSRMALGSVTEKVLHQSKGHPVLVVNLFAHKPSE